MEEESKEKITPQQIINSTGRSDFVGNNTSSGGLNIYATNTNSYNDVVADYRDKLIDFT